MEEGQAQKKAKTMPRKANYRMRAHCNPLNDITIDQQNQNSPLTPWHVDWSIHYDQDEIPYSNSNLYIAEVHPIKYSSTRVLQSHPCIDILDIGCGFGGLLFALSPIFPNKRILGIEIRNRVSDYVAEKIIAMRNQHPGEFKNIAVLRTNAMKLLFNYIPKSSVEKMFFCFADPQFKKKNHRRRIITQGLLTDYAYCLKTGGRIYSITDVKQLHDWHEQHLEMHPLFQKVDDSDDQCIEVMQNATEEGQKVNMKGGNKYFCVYEKIDIR